MRSPQESLGIRRVAALHVFVRDLERSRDFYVDQLDFAEIARSTPEYETEHRARASAVQADGIRFVLMEPLGSKGEGFHWLEKHPEGVGRVVFEVDDAERAFRLISERGGTCITGLRRRVVDGTHVVWFDIATAIGDTLFRFIQYPDKTPVMPLFSRLDPPLGGNNKYGFSEIDHITCNFLTLQPAIAWFEEVLGFTRYWEVAFHTQDVTSGQFEGSGLKSIVVADPVSGFKVATNEPAAPHFRASQIYLYCEDHKGPGIQHVALATQDLVGAVEQLQSSEVQFMPTPGPYYDYLQETLQKNGVQSIDEDIETLRRLQILVDGSKEKQYLLQIFLAEASRQFGDTQAGPLFLELIQRKGDLGFGAGNFRALFESIERSQQEHGRA